MSNERIRVAKVVFDLPLDTAFYYLIPPELEKIDLFGHQVKADFRGRNKWGYVIGYSMVDPETAGKLKSITDLKAQKTCFDRSVFSLARWMSVYYMCSLGQSLKVAIPRLAKGTRMSRTKELYLPEISEDYPDEDSIQLTAEQQHAVAEILNAMENPSPRPVVLKGVTGSGKTEVYFRLISQTLARGREAIVLVPEIALTPQIFQRFRSRFGDRVSLLHSRLTQGQRRREWNRILDGTASIALGPRSAVFAPFKKLGLIIIDEEMETSYKQNETPRYHAREVAIQRAKQTGAVVVMGSATPSIETYYRARTGKYRLLELTRRISDTVLPRVKIINMKEELFVRKNMSIFSQELRRLLKENLDRGEQTLLFLNRRGYSTFVMCRSCGEAIKCRNCHISMKYHFSSANLKCHYCDYKIPLPRVCPKCQSTYIKYFGIGTQKVEQQLRKLFPQARVARLDSDTSSEKNYQASVMSDLSRGEVDILIGTQMIAKGHDFPNISLVGVIAADTTLNLPDFRACERTFQLLTQVSGRAGRGNKEGTVLIQTYSPTHYAIHTCIKHDYDAFFQQEIKFREELGYPPFSRLINLIITGTKEKKVEDAAVYLAGLIKQLNQHGSLKVLGPSAAPLERIKGQFRWQILLKGDRLYRLRNLVRKVMERAKKNKLLNKVKILVDVEPYNLL